MNGLNLFWFSKMVKLLNKGGGGKGGAAGAKGAKVVSVKAA